MPPLSSRRSATFVCLLAAALALSTRCHAESPPAKPTTGTWANLFTDDGPPRGWVVRQWDDVSQEAPGQWTAKAGVLTSGQPRGSWLMYERELADFDLEYEFKLGPMGNSGLALRARLKGDPAFDGIELQMVDLRYNLEAKPAELTGGLYRAVAPLKQVYQPEKWNRYEISLQGAHLRVKLNGEVMHDLQLDEQVQVVQRHDGSDVPPIKDRPRRGHIGFQQLSRGNADVQIRAARLRTHN